MRVYIANAMTGIPRFNFPWFDRARDFLLQQGHEPVSPADISRRWPHYQQRSLADCLREDYQALVTCDAIALGPDWYRSKGATRERRVALDCGIPAYHVDPDAALFVREVTVGFSGYARAGKDTAVQGLQMNGFHRVAFADALRDMLLALDPILGSAPDGNIQRLSDALRSHDWDTVKTTYPEVRPLLQRLGTEAGRNVLGEDTWVNAAFQRNPHPAVAISDCRFPNEAAAIKARHGIVIRIERPGVGPANDHPSETALDGWDFDAVIYNDKTPADLRARVYALVRSYTNPITVAQ